MIGVSRFFTRETRKINIIQVKDLLKSFMTVKTLQVRIKDSCIKEKCRQKIKIFH